jgi:hypothetical protein
MTKALIWKSFPGKPAIITGFFPLSQRIRAFFEVPVGMTAQVIGFACRGGLSICFAYEYSTGRHDTKFLSLL